MDVGRAVLGLVLPERCLACGRGEELLCAECRRGLLVLRGTLCARCGCPTAWPVERCGECAGRRLAFASARSAVAYDAAARALVSAWKERGIARIAGLAAELVAETVPKPPVEALAFIPGEGDRVGWRGANPARELAGALAGRWGLPVVPLLARTRSARPQRGPHEAERRANIRAAFRRPRGVAEGRRPRRRRLHDRSHRGRRGHASCGAPARGRSTSSPSPAPSVVDRASGRLHIIVPTRGTGQALRPRGTRTRGIYEHALRESLRAREVSLPAELRARARARGPGRQSGQSGARAPGRKENDLRKSRSTRGARLSGRRGIATLLGLVVALAAAAAPATGQSPVLDPIDSQKWVDQGVLTWADYLPVPDQNPDFYDPDSVGSQVQYRTAIILVDYPDQPFLITQAPGTHPFGNPQPGWTPVAQEDVNEWMYDYYAVPNQYNGFKTLHGYWMEDTHGRIGIDVEVFGPYRMAAKSFEYGLATDFNSPVGTQSNSFCPAGHTCNRNIRTDGLAAWQADTGCASLTACGYNNGFYVTAGHDESSTWQEFGEMLWTARSRSRPSSGLRAPRAGRS